uniref:hypothetical protein n=1 Tax=Lactiplantibacillus plantarum TaxID=1590 RepID=UPI00358DBB56
MRLISVKSELLKIDPLVKSIFFDLFIFTIGFKVGPSFIRSLKSTGLRRSLAKVSSSR